MNEKMLQRINYWFITWFGCGKVPIAPGTAGSIGALPLCWAVASFSFTTKLCFAISMTCVAILSVAWSQARTKERDPQFIVIDEVVGMLWSCLLVGDGWLLLLIAFGLFRLFDVLKPFPGNIIDRRSKTATSPMVLGACIVLDDVAAALYVLLVLNGTLIYFKNWLPAFLHY